MLCPRCAGDAWHWHRCTGDGRLYSWTTTHRPLHPSFTATPFTVAIVELDEGPRIVAPLLNCDEGDLRVGLPVRLCPHSGGGPVIPAFTARGEAATMELVFVGEPVTAQHAERVGLVNRVVPRAEGLAYLDALVDSVLRASRPQTERRREG